MALEDTTERPSKIIVMEIEGSTHLEYRDIGNIRLSMHRARLASRPALPKSGKEVMEKLQNYPVSTA